MNVVAPARAGVVVQEDGQVTITVSRDVLLTLETFVAQPGWKRAARDAAAALARVGV